MTVVLVVAFLATLSWERAEERAGLLTHLDAVIVGGGDFSVNCFHGTSFWMRRRQGIYVQEEFPGMGMKSAPDH